MPRKTFSPWTPWSTLSRTWATIGRLGISVFFNQIRTWENLFNWLFLNHYFRHFCTYQIAIEILELNESSKEYESLIALPKISTCSFMTTIYKKYFYDEISKYSNLPSYDACPVPKGQYDIRDYPLEMDKFRDSPLTSLVKPGNFRLNVFMVKDDVAQYGISIYGRITEKS